jgi:hypothetical protein
MKQLIEETLATAKERFLSFGFTQSQVESLLLSAQSDLTKVLVQLETLINETPDQREEISRSLHSLKGLLYNMGNNQVADLIVELKSHPDKGDIISQIKKIIES